MKKIVLAFDSFKGCMTADDACRAAALGLRERHPDAEIVSLPLSDGGEGLVTCVCKRLDVSMVTCNAHSPLLESINATYAVSRDGKTAYMEMAETSGLTLVPLDKRNPMLTSTYGVGDMILDAARRGCRQIVMGIGGSATCDGGKGMIQCLLDNDADINRLPEITVACDVTNPLYGENGAAYVFAPQKGATPEQVAELDKRLRDFARETEARGMATAEMACVSGAGAAGGLGYGLMAYLHATLRSGIDIILDIMHFDDTIHGADIILTGEGKSDSQTLMGKVPQGVLRRADGIPVHILSGAIEDTQALLHAGFASVRSINAADVRPLNMLMQRDVAMENMRRACREIL